jgi:enamine deaminase RidA (YjgF/YER057c/UK114 family)
LLQSNTVSEANLAVARLLNPRKILACAAVLCTAAAVAWPSRKKNAEEPTQTLQLPRELPAAVQGETRRLTFYVTPLSAKGLLSQQVRDALKSLEREAGGETILQIRAFVAGSADLRRVRELVSEIFTEKRQPLPVVSLIQTGGLPLSGAQVVLEAVASARKDVHPGGLAWFSARIASAEDPLAAVAPLAEKSLAGLREELRAAGAAPEAVLRVTCFLSSLDNLNATRQAVAAEFPKAALNFLQTQREPDRAVAGCEGVAALPGNASGRLEALNPAESGESQIAVIGTPHVVFTGAQVSFGFGDQDARLAFERMQKVLEQAGVSPGDVAFTRFYPLSRKMADQVRRMRVGFFDHTHPPAGTLLVFEGLPSLDAGFAVDVVAAKD